MFEELMEKAQSRLSEPSTYCDTTMLCAIGYAILAVAVAIKEQGVKSVSTEGESSGS